MREAAAVVPQGGYCYTYVAMEPARAEGALPRMKVKPCPFLKNRADWPEQRNGYCRLLKRGDSTQGLRPDGLPLATSHLWDSVKECGINDTLDGE
ncbi:MAG: hypothetical protein DI537_10570 [Stutzerimonas stutzeri]|nr:MAG: hypothetical protein DI537_10570 [Stutzerimonas stutzeri]